MFRSTCWDIILITFSVCWMQLKEVWDAYAHALVLADHCECAEIPGIQLAMWDYWAQCFGMT